MRLLSLLATALAPALALAASRTSAPSGALVVNPSSGPYKTISAAVAALPSDGSARSIFVYPGTYKEQVLINRSGATTIYGYTTSTTDYTKNVVVLTHSASLASAGSDDATGTLRVHSDNVKIYNLDVRNDFGVAASNGQALALSAYGSQFGAYACRFFSYQDTVLAEQGTQVYLKSYIEGAVDYIFGQRGQAYFKGCTLASKGAGAITASGRSSNDGTMYLFESNTVVKASDAFANVTGNVFLGRPWSNYAKVIFKNTIITAPMNKALWSPWSTGTPNTDHVTFAEYGTSGAGVAGAARPAFASVLSASEAAAYTVGAVLGSGYAGWVDTTYL